ncbi:MAG: M23 family metallopeptidase [Pseudomonadota bacterium]
MAAFTAQPALSDVLRENCVDEICIEFTQGDDQVDFVAVNNFEHVTISLVFTLDLDNMRFAGTDGLLFQIPPQSRRALFWLEPERNGSWAYEFEYFYRFGSVFGQHDPDIVYRLPVESGRRVKISQSCGGLFSHRPPREHAIDIPLPRGEEVRASRDGKVVFVKEDSSRGGPTEAFMDDGNELLVEHGDGSIGVYTHFVKDGIAVEPGDRISAGDLVGYVGSTGWSSGPHIHFEVVYPDRASPELEWQTVAVPFDTKEGVVTCPKSGFLTAK